MNLSISKRMGVIISVTLFVSLSCMLILLLTQEESSKKLKAKEGVSELSKVLTESITFSMAGEHGRGFAVVADEVRKLSERTAKATKEIAETIQAVQTEAVTANKSMLETNELIANGMKNTLEVNELLEEINESSGKMTDLIGQITAASEEQSATAEQISKILNQ